MIESKPQPGYLILAELVRGASTSYALKKIHAGEDLNDIKRWKLVRQDLSDT